MRAPNRVEVASAAALFAAYPAFVIAEHHDLIGQQIYHWGTEGVTVVVLGNLIWWGTVNSPAARWARDRANGGWMWLTSRRRPPLPPPPTRVGEHGRPFTANSPPATPTPLAKTRHPTNCTCEGSGVVHCPFQTTVGKEA